MPKNRILEKMLDRLYASLISGLAWAPDGLRIASGGTDSTVIVWDSARGQSLLQWQVPDDREGGTRRSLAWSPDGTMLATGSVWGAITIWDPGSGQELVVLGGHRESVTGLAWSADGQLLVSGSTDGTVRLWGVTGME